MEYAAMQYFMLQEIYMKPLLYMMKFIIVIKDKVPLHKKKLKKRGKENVK